MTLRERCKRKVSSANLVPLQHTLHQHLTDGDNRAAIIRPTRRDLLQLVKVLEDALQRESQSSQQAWQPRWEEAVDAAWPRKHTIGTMCRAEYEYQVDFFDLKPRNIFNCKAPPSFQQLREESGVRTYPNFLQHGLDTFKAPRSILSVIAVAVSQMWFVSRASDRRYKSSFLEDLDVMSYVINVLGSPAPDYFKSLKRPSLLPALPFDRPSSTLSSPRLRRWPSLPILRPPATDTSSLQLASKAKDAALYADSIEPENQEPNESFSAEQSDMQSGDAPFGASWHQEWQSLDDEQDLVLNTAASALAEDLQASSQTGVKTTGNAAAASSLFDFLVSEEPLQEVASKLHWIEERREVMLEQWKEVLQERETRRWLEEQQGIMQ